MRRLFRDGTVAIAAATAILFLLGWFYLYGYYSFFDIDLETLELPTYTALIFSLMPILEIASKIAPWVFWLVFASVCVVIPLGDSSRKGNLRTFRALSRWEEPPVIETLFLRRVLRRFWCWKAGLSSPDANCPKKDPFRYKDDAGEGKTLSIHHPQTANVRKFPFLEVSPFSTSRNHIPWKDLEE